MKVQEVKLILSKYQHGLLDFAAKRFNGLENLKLALHKELLENNFDSPFQKKKTQKMLKDTEDLIYLINGMTGTQTTSLSALNITKNKTVN